MELKKLITLLLVFGVFATQLAYAPSYAISENTSHTKKIKKEKVKTQINKTEYINLDFWNGFNDSNLKYYILRAMESNHDLKIAKNNADIYYQYVKMQRSAQMPTVGAGFSPAYYKMVDKSAYDWSFAVPVYVNYEADIFLKNRDKTLSEKKSYEMSLLDERSAYISVASMVGTVYFNILKLDKAIEIQEEIVQLRKRIYELMVLSNEEGITSIQDVIRANKSYIAGNSDLINLKKERIQLADNLAVLCGVSPEEISGFQFSDIENITYTNDVPKSLPSDAITARPDYLRAEKNVEKLGLDVRVAKKEFLPSMNITGLSLFNAADFGSIFTTKSALVGLGGILAADLFTGGRKLANLKIKKSEYENALQNYEKTNLTAIQELNDALVAITHDEEKYNENKKQNELEIKDYALRELRYDEGVISNLELIQSKENLLSVKKLVLYDKTDCFIDYIGLYKALGAKI